MDRMSIDDRIKAAREAETAQMDAANRKIAEEEEKRRKQADEHRTKAEALMPEVSDGVRLLRLNQERSTQLVDDLRTPTPGMSLVWQLGSGWTAHRRRKRRAMIGWEVTTGSSEPNRSIPGVKAFPAYRVFIPFQGELRVQGVMGWAPPDTWRTLKGHVRAGIVDVPVLDGKVATSTAEIHADETVSALLDILAKHLALLGAGFE